MLAGGKYKGMIASTIPEIKGALPLVEEGLVEEVRSNQTHKDRSTK
jgi:hypothetical protein